LLLRSLSLSLLLLGLVLLIGLLIIGRIIIALLVTLLIVLLIALLIIGIIIIVITFFTFITFRIGIIIRLSIRIVIGLSIRVISGLILFVRVKLCECIKNSRNCLSERAEDIRHLWGRAWAGTRAWRRSVNIWARSRAGRGTRTRNRAWSRRVGTA
jgi:hypothetical protein